MRATRSTLYTGGIALAHVLEERCVDCAGHHGGDMRVLRPSYGKLLTQTHAQPVNACFAPTYALGSCQAPGTIRKSRITPSARAARAC
jgi:hypothetical protein